MNDSTKLVQIYEGRLQVSASSLVSGPVVLGRMADAIATEQLFECRGERLVVAERNEDNVSRRHVRLELGDSSDVSVENVSTRDPRGA